MGDGLMVVTGLPEITVRTKSVRVDVGPLDDVGFNNWLKARFLVIYDSLRHHLSTALQHSHYDGLSSAPAPLDPKFLPSDVGLVNLDNALKRPFTVHVLDMLADLVCHAPSRLVGHAKLPLQFLCGNAMTRRGEQINGIEPKLERRAAVLERRPDRGVEMIAAPLAGIGPLGLDPVPVGRTLAFGALVALSKAGLKQVLQAGFVRGEKLKKLADREGGFDFHVLTMAQLLPYVKGIIP